MTLGKLSQSFDVGGKMFEVRNSCDHYIISEIIL
jgi:hypothetical protein